MNYFEFYGIDIKFDMDPAILKKQFLQKSKELHPDFHSLEDDAVQSDILEQASYNNLAYKTLKAKHRRYRYVLELLGVKFEEGKETVPQEFLMEMMDINESIMELQFNFTPEAHLKTCSQIEMLDKQLDNGVYNLIEQLQKQDFTINSVHLEKELLDVKAYLLKKKYLQRINSNLEKLNTSTL